VPRWWENIRAQISPLLICLLLLLPAALFLGVVIGTSSHVQEYSVVVAGALAMVLIVLLRLDELAVVLILAVHLYVDWFLGLHLIGIIMALMLLFVYYFARSADHPWTEPRLLWLWALFLVLTIYPAIYGGQLRLYDLATFYPSLILGAFLMFWLGTVIVRDSVSLRRLLKILAVLGTLLAVHTIIQATTGIFLFGSQRVNDLLSQVGNYQLTNSTATRAVSFLIDPNWNGTLLAMMAFLPLGLFFESSSLLGKAFYLFETILILMALVFTYSNSGWVGAITGIIVFMLFAGSKRSSLLVLSFILLSAVILIVFFPNEMSIQLQHASNPQEVIQRVGAWQTALQTIRAFPLTGIGLGYQAYELRTQPYSALEQGIFSQPHDCYLEWATMAGIPVLLVFVALVLCALWLALHTWARADTRSRTLIACGIAAIVSLSMSSITIDGWTHPVMAEVGWLVLGAITSPLLAQSFSVKQSGE
ncbi:MAG TPA: O-antigen ligase family protein, partial [Ktedonobacteraceae bacterium]|nr:O-antigen ligase family protein [Ktedonobacteraceae bacterium]